jgi:hypothetical protein
MAYKSDLPLTNDQGQVRDLTRDDWLWFVADEDFGGFEQAMNFLTERDAFFHTAESHGIAREAFLAFAPNKPGFIARATAAMEAIIARSTHAAE